MRVTVVTPDKSYFDGEARMVTVQAMDGEMGILPKHAPLIARLGHGVARIEADGGTQRIAIYGGFVKVQDDVVTVLAGGAATSDEATPDAAAQAVSEAKQRLEQLRGSPDGAVDLPEAEETLRRAQALQKLVAN